MVIQASAGQNEIPIQNILLMASAILSTALVLTYMIRDSLKQEKIKNDDVNT